MDGSTLNKLSHKYKDYINHFFIENAKYRNFNETIHWCFCYNEDLSISATTNRKINLILINYKWFIYCYSNKKDYEIEYFLIHETRHIFQHLIIKDFNNSVETEIPEEIIKKWIMEGENYIRVKDDNGEVNNNYFRQDVELDAFAYSFALMSFKYKGKYDSLLYVDDIYKNELKDVFDGLVGEWKSYFASL